MTLQRQVRAVRTFSFAADPLTGMLRRWRLLREDGQPRALVLVLIAWVPLCIGALARVVFGEKPHPILFDLSLHVRLLVSLPLVVLAGRLLDERCGGAIEQLYEDDLAPTDRLDRIIDRAEWLRDSRLVAVALIAISVAGGQLVLWQFVGATGLFAGVAHTDALSFARLWYGFVALPLVQFFVLRWAWHWIVWSYVVVRLSRLPLDTIAMHPDHAGGLGMLAGPIAAFSTFALGFSSMLAGAWGTQILHHRATMQTFVPSFVAFVLATAIIACGPQIAFIGVLYNVRRRDLRNYHRFALGYVRDFHRKWLLRPTSDELGSQDIQALNDLGGSYGTLEKTRLLPVSARLFAGLWIAALIPMLPIALTAVPASDLVKHIGGVMLGGLPL